MSLGDDPLSIRDLYDLPPVLNVEEGGAVCGLKRAAAYRAAREYLSTGGRRGLPVIELSKGRMVVPTPKLLARLGLDLNQDVHSNDGGDDVGGRSRNACVPGPPARHPHRGGAEA